MVSGVTPSQKLPGTSLYILKLICKIEFSKKCYFLLDFRYIFLLFLNSQSKKPTGKYKIIDNQLLKKLPLGDIGQIKIAIFIRRDI